MTPFALLCHECGLSTREAAAFHDVRHDTALSWSSGRRNPPPAVLADLVALRRRIERAADEAIALMRSPASRGADVIELGFCVDDAEAKGLGLPCAGAHAALLARVVAVAIEDGRAVRLVPRGSTSATAAASDAHGR